MTKLLLESDSQSLSENALFRSRLSRWWEVGSQAFSPKAQISPNRKMAEYQFMGYKLALLLFRLVLSLSILLIPMLLSTDGLHTVISGYITVYGAIHLPFFVCPAKHLTL